MFKSVFSVHYLVAILRKVVSELTAVVLSSSLSVAFFNSSSVKISFVIFVDGFFFLHCRKVQSCCYLSCQEFHPSSNNCFHLQVFQDERPDRINKTDWLILFVEPIKFCRGKTRDKWRGECPASRVGRGSNEVLHLRRKWQENAGFFNLRSKNLLELIFEPEVCIR